MYIQREAYLIFWSVTLLQLCNGCTSDANLEAKEVTGNLRKQKSEKSRLGENNKINMGDG